ncbi:MAG: TlyA family RNA methyltransferase [Polyangiaceae bacterium]|nr:TlyA family RNA methyltransferase [Polyangiaceae bacterium]
MKRRTDILMVEQGLATTRSQARALVMAGRVYWGERRVEKVGTLLPEGATLVVRGGERYVSRGGHKLEGALRDLELVVTGSVAVDIGASTGGFTDCLLQAGAARVYAVDVGQGQLAERLRRDARVVVMDRTNARDLGPEAFTEPIDLVMVDASFISLDRLLPAIGRVLRPWGHLLALVKPQFEAGRAEASRGRGVIRDPVVREAAIARAREAIGTAGFVAIREHDSRVAGPKGNLERFVLARRVGPGGLEREDPEIVEGVGPYHRSKAP